MKRSARGGFTLPEVLVTIAIVATLAAVLLPALNSQLTKGEASRASNDLLAVQTAINTFVSDVRRYPDALAQLTTKITTGQPDINGNPYPDKLAARWKGPYLNEELVGGKMATGFGGEIQADFIASSSTEFNGIGYVKVSITPITLDEFNAVDEIIDDIASSTGGQLRWSTAASGTASFFAVPIQ